MKTTTTATILNDEARKLILKHRGYAESLAKSKKRSCNIGAIYFEDLKSAAHDGLTEAALKYDKSRGTEFKTYAFRRINGAMDSYVRDIVTWKSSANSSPMVSLDVIEDISVKNAINLDDLFSIIIKPLSAKAQSILRYYYQDNFSKEQIGKLAEVDIKSVPVLLSCYRKRLKEYWGDRRYELLEELHNKIPKIHRKTDRVG